MIIQPIIDLMTSLSTEKFAISIGALSKTLIMSFLFFYILLYVYKRYRKMIWMYLASFFAILLMLVINFFLKSHFALYEEVNFALKTSYYLVMVYTVMMLLENKTINKAFIYRAVKGISLIIGISYWIAILTKTSIGSYTYEKIGYSGWFYAANELSVTVIILLALTMINLRYEKTMTGWAAFVLILSMIPMIGTKTAFLGGMLILFFYIAYLLLKFNLQVLKRNFPFLGIVVIFVCFIPLSPIATNTEQLDLSIPPKDMPVPEEIAEDTPPLTGKILSSRNVYFQDIKKDFMYAKGLRKAFGLGYAGDYTKEPKLIEMDFFDLFFSYGVIGSILLLLPLALLCKKIITFPINIEKIILLLTIGLCFGIAFLAGHVLFAPSVMTYIAILFLAMGLSNEDTQNNGGLYDAR